MVVIDGPRFSTRAESQWYAAQGGTLINMTGAPEAALARELRMCYSALALVTDMDAGVEGESGVGQEEVFALFRSNLERLTGLLATRGRGAARPRGLLLLDLGRRHRAHLRRARGGGPVRVLLTGSAGFIGTAVGEVLEEDGHEVVRVDLMLPMAHGAADPPAGTHHLDVRDAGAWVDLLRGVDAVCHQAAVVGAGVRVGDLPEYAGHNDLGTAALLAAMHEAGVDRLVLASSMVVYGEGRYRCPEHGDQTPAAPGGRRARGGRLRQPLPALRPPAGLGAGRGGRAARPALVVRRQQGRPGALHLRVGAPGGRASGGAALPQRLRPGDAAGHAVLRCGGDCSGPRSSAASPRRSSRTAARPATSCTWRTSRGPTSQRCGR